jgi:hypothetical protein
MIRTLQAVALQFFCVALILSFAAVSRADHTPDVPTVNASIGGCQADFTVKDGAGKPLYNAKIDISIKYGFMNMHKTDLESNTNTDGQARFIGLPNFSKKPLEFVVKSGTVSRTLTDNPTDTCRAVFDITLTTH